MGPWVPAAHMISPSNVDASGYRMFQLNVLMPALFATRGGGGVRMGPPSSSPPAANAPASGVRRNIRSTLSTGTPAPTSESPRDLMRAAPLTHTLAVAH